MEWRRAFGLALVARSVVQMPFTHDRMLRSIRGELPMPEIAGVSEELARQKQRAGLLVIEQMAELVMREARRWLG